VQSIYYDDYNNNFEDDFGNTVYNIANLLPTDKIIEYKQKGGTYYSELNGEVIEIVFPIRDNYRLIAYYQETNTFMDEEDTPIFNMFSLLTSTDLYLFKRNKKNAVIKGIQGQIVDLLYI